MNGNGGCDGFPAPLWGGMSLLHDVCELMSEETVAGRSARIVHAAAEKDVTAVRECERAESLADLTSLGIPVNAHTREVVPERVFHAPTCQRPERLSPGLPQG